MLGRAFARLAAVLLLSGLAINSALAHVIDRIEVDQVGDEAEIQIMFDVRIQYLREAALKNGEIHVYINLLEPDPDRSVMVPESMDSPFVVVLGIAQDAGYPQAGCRNECCARAWVDWRYRQYVACLAIVDPNTDQRWLLDCTPDFR